MMPLIASSKLNGCKITGFAFGIVVSEMASVTARHNPSVYWRTCPAEDASSAASSASCYHEVEDIGILPVVEPEAEFVQVQRQILAADFVERAHHAPLEQAPERFNVVRVDVAANVDAVIMADDFVRVVGNFPDRLGVRPSPAT